MRWFVIIIASGLSIAGAMPPGWAEEPPSASTNQAAAAVTISNVLESFDLSFAPPQLVPSGTGVLVRMEGAMHGNTPGAPDLPFFAKLIRLPAEGKPGIHVMDVKTIEISNVYVRPVPVPVTRVVMESESPEGTSELAIAPDEAIYGRDAFWPPKLATLDEAWMGTNRLLRVGVQIGRYNPARNVLSIVTACRVVVDLN